MNIVMAILALIGDWLLFEFPVYQAELELEEYRQFIGQYRELSAKTKDVSWLWWIAPFYKISKEKERAVGILKQTVHSRHEFDESFGFLNKATAWWYVALGGELGGIHSLYELFEALHIEVNWVVFILIVVVLVLFCLAQVRYRLSDKRHEQMYKELFGDEQ